MRPFRIQTDLPRAVVNGFSYPLGLDPKTAMAPHIGYTLDYIVGDEDEPDTYSIYAVTSHERLAALVQKAFELLPDQVHGIVEIGSRDAYRALDIFMSQEPLDIQEFLAGWHEFESFLLEDGSVGCGANAEDPYVEIFLDQWKGVSIHVPVLMREKVEDLLHGLDLKEVSETWPTMSDDEANDSMRVRPVLLIEDEFSPGLDEILLNLRQVWQMELNVDPESNIDGGGREIGHTLWHAMVIVAPRDDPDAPSSYASIWATAASLAEMETLIDTGLDAHPGWQIEEIYTIDRVAFDERPDELADLAPRRETSGVHLVEFET